MGDVANVARVHLLTDAPASEDVLAALGLLPHRVRILPPEPAAVLQVEGSDLVLVDGRSELAQARGLCRLLAEVSVPTLLVVTEGGLAAVSADWGMTDVVLPTAGPAELSARIRLAAESGHVEAEPDPDQIVAGGLRIDAGGYTARMDGEPLNLTYKEFELLRHLAQHPGRVFSRAQLLQEVWGYDYFGGTRTVDVHVRRLRAKLGPEHDAMIVTVRNVGYRFDGLPTPPDAAAPAS